MILCARKSFVFSPVIILDEMRIWPFDLFLNLFCLLLGWPQKQNKKLRVDPANAAFSFVQTKVRLLVNPSLPFLWVRVSVSACARLARLCAFLLLVSSLGLIDYWFLTLCQPRGLRHKVQESQGTKQHWGLGKFRISGYFPYYVCRFHRISHNPVKMEQQTYS